MNPRNAICPLTIVLLASFTAQAGTLDFEGEPASNGVVPLSGEYLDSGVVFSTTDGSTWGGVGNGDPGQWELEGTAGSVFLGFEGRSSTVSIHFDAPVEDFQLDVARGAGTTANFFDFIVVSGLRDNAVVDSTTAYLGDVNDWKTLGLSGELDQVVVFSSGFYFSFRFGVDNLRWSGGVAADPRRVVDIDVRPGSAKNAVQLTGNGVVPVVLFGSADFDVESVDRDSLGLGPDRAPVAHVSGPHKTDRNKDGHPDLLLHHRVAECGLEAGAEELCLHGAMRDGGVFEGCDSVRAVAVR